MIDLLEKLVEADFADQFKPASEEEIGKRVLEYIKSECTQNPDGSWDCKGNVDLSEMGFKRLPVRFGKVGRYFWCDYNQLRTLEGSPKEVGGGFDCGDNQLHTLEGGPKEVGGSFWCRNNQLHTLEGGPKEVGGSFYCNDNQLRTLKGIGEVRGEIYTTGNLVPEKELLATIGR